MKTIEFKQRNMYRNNCFINTFTALAGIDGVYELDVDMPSKTIRLQMESEAIGRKKIQTMIEYAIKKGNQPDLSWKV